MIRLTSEQALVLARLQAEQDHEGPDPFTQQVQTFNGECEPFDACKLTGRCWTHSTWEQKASEPVIGFAWAGAKMRASKEWTDGSLFEGDEMCCSVRGRCDLPGCGDKNEGPDYVCPNCLGHGNGVLTTGEHARSWYQINNGMTEARWAMVVGECP